MYPLIGKSKNNEPSQEQLANIIQLYKHGDLATLLIFATYVLSDFPNSIALHNFLGICHTKLGNFKAAIENYKILIIYNPKDCDSYFNLANLHMDVGEYDDALIGYQKILKINSTDFDAYNNMGICWKQKGDFDNAINSFQRAIELNPKFTIAHENLSKALDAIAKSETGIRG